MTSKPYYTLCIWDEHHLAWFDNFGSYIKAEVEAEYRDARDGGYRKAHLAIIKTGELAVDMIKARDALPMPKA